MAVETVGDLFSALASGRFDDLLGSRETDQIEFKSEPYVLETKRQKWELAKDVASLANAGGGVLVIGATTRRETTEISDTVIAVRGTARDLVDPDQLHKVIQEWAHPSVTTRLHWFPPTPVDESRDLFVIEVAAHPEHDRYVVVRKLIGEDEGEWAAVAVPIRTASQTRWLKVEELQGLIADGLRARRPSASAATNEPAATNERADHRLDTLTKLMGWETEPVLWLQALPPPGRSLHDVLFDPEDGIRGVFDRYHEFQLRPMGFGLAASRPETVSGSLVVRESDRRATLVDQDAYVTVGAHIEDDFLGWGSRPYREGEDTRTLINPVPLTEFTLEFARFVEEVLIGDSDATQWRLRAVGSRLTSGGTIRLAPRRLDFSLFPGQSPPASDGYFDDEIRATRNPGVDAYQLLVRIYNWFGLPPAAIQFAEDGGISAEQIIAL
jgi:hypothetical protein